MPFNWILLAFGRPAPIECTSVVAPPISITIVSSLSCEKTSAAIITAVGVGIIILPTISCILSIPLALIILFIKTSLITSLTGSTLILFTTGITFSLL